MLSDCIISIKYGRSCFSVVEGLLQEARALPIDKKAVKRLVDKINKRMLKDLENHQSSYEDSDPVSSFNWDSLGPYSVNLDDPKGERVSIDIYFRVNIADRRTKDFILSGATGAYKSRTDSKVVIINLNGSIRLGLLRYVMEEVDSVFKSVLLSYLLHELTHAIDPDQKQGYDKSVVKDFKIQSKNLMSLYLNDPQEIRAFLQEIVNEVDTSKMIQAWIARKGASDIKFLVSSTDVWKRMDMAKYLSNKNKKYVYKSVYRHLQDKGLIE